MTRGLARRVGAHALAVALGTVPGCDGDGSGGEMPEEEKTEFACELGVLDEDGRFIPASPQTRAELQLGFQGFLFVAVHVRSSADDVPRQVDVSTRVTVEGEDPIGDQSPDIQFNDHDGDRLTDEVLLFFNSSTPSALHERPAEVALELESDHSICTVVGDFLLADDDPCIHTGDDPICPDDTGATGTGTTGTGTTGTGTTGTGTTGTGVTGTGATGTGRG